MASNELKISILVIDDDPIIRNLLKSILKDRTTVFVVESPSEGFKVLRNEAIDIIICDFRLPEMDGLQVLDIVKQDYPLIEVIMISDSGEMDTVISALRKGAADYFRKPFSPAEIWLAIERTLKISNLNNNLTQYRKKNSCLKEEVNDELGSTIVGSSASVAKVLQQMRLLAQTPDTSVLVIGESGTGKELVARGIHDLSKRRDELFGAVNMSAIPDALFESEFFGHKKGSFTGAISDRAGWFETINGGTLFLDEIGEMSMSLQVKLLRVIEDRRYIKVGNQREQVFDIRIVAATNKSIEQLTDGKSFRLDLFHRLSTFIIHLPPLRERKEDIPELTSFFLKKMSSKMRKQITSVHKDVFNVLKNYSFPGNIRELKNLIERAVILCEGNTLLPQHFNSYGIQGLNLKKNDSDNEIFNLKELEERTILKVLEKVNYNKAEAARLLNLDWNALYRRMQKYNISMPE